MGEDRTFPTPEKQPEPEMAHVLFADVVGYSRFATDEQPKLLHQLRAAVRNSAEFNRGCSNRSLICISTGDGMALVFLESDVRAPIRAAQEITVALREGATFGIRIGIHSGPVYRVPDINGTETVVGAGINLAQRVMDCGDAGHILMSQTHASFLREFGNWRTNLHDLGEAEVKHGVRLHLFNYCEGADGNPDLPSKLARPATAASSSLAGRRVVLIYKRHAEPDETLLAALDAELRERGCNVFIDRHLRIGLDWAREIERALRSADSVIPLLSPAAVTSEMLSYELEVADEAAQRTGHPRLLPVRVNWEGPLPECLASILNPIQYTLWRGPEDTAAVVAELVAAIAAPGTGPTRGFRALEPPGGAMPLDSQYYIERPTDAEFHAAIARHDSIVLVEGARQMGKTSLLSRGLQQARKSGARVTCTDFQKLNASDLASLESFYMTLGTALANQLNLDKFPEDTWRPKSGPNQNFESYLRREVLVSQQAPFIWALDEVDRLFTCPFGSEVFGLFRSWHNARALDPESPWHRLTMIICYATEAHLFITDLNQSPFNVGTRVRLRDFGLAEVRQLNQLYGQPLTTSDEFDCFVHLFGGQPYLVRRGLHELVARRLTLAELERSAPLEQGPFADHLKRFLVLLSGNDATLQCIREVLAGKKNGDAKLFHRLRAAGLLRGETPAEAAFRCDLYLQYFRRHLA
jgi:class 3 adenylate cyclase